MISIHRISRANYLSPRTVHVNHGYRDGRTVSRLIHPIHPPVMANCATVKYVYQALSVFLIEETEKDIPKGLSMLDLKIIAMESHVGESIKVGHTKSTMISRNRAYENIASENGAAGSDQFAALNGIHRQDAKSQPSNAERFEGMDRRGN